MKSSNFQNGRSGGGGGGVTAGFIGDVRRANVLLTRAVRKMYVIGDARAWLGVTDSALWRNFAERFGAREAAAESAEAAAAEAMAAGEDQPVPWWEQEEEATTRARDELL